MLAHDKITAKLGPDIKKPDACTSIPKEKHKEIVWPLPVEELLYVGPATKKKLNNRGIYTIGELNSVDTSSFLCYNRENQRGDSL